MDVPLGDAVEGLSIFVEHVTSNYEYKIAYWFQKDHCLSTPPIFIYQQYGCA